MDRNERSQFAVSIERSQSEVLMVWISFAVMIAAPPP